MFKIWIFFHNQQAIISHAFHSSHSVNAEFSKQYLLVASHSDLLNVP